MPLLFAFVVVIIALQRERTKHALHLRADPPLVVLARLGLVGSVDFVRGLLQQPAHQRIGRLEEDRANQHFHLLDRQALGWVGLEADYQLLDFLVLGQEDLRREVFFLKSAVRSVRVCSTISWAYWPTRVWNC